MTYFFRACIDDPALNADVQTTLTGSDLEAQARDLEDRTRELESRQWRYFWAGLCVGVSLTQLARVIM